MDKPPDIDFRRIIDNQMEDMKYLDDHKIPFKLRCAWMDFFDSIFLKLELISEYRDGLGEKIWAVEQAQDRGRRSFGNI